MKFEDICDVVFSCCTHLVDRIGATTNEKARVQPERDNLGELGFRYGKGQILFSPETREGFSTKFPLLGVIYIRHFSYMDETVELRSSSFISSLEGLS